MDRRFYYFFCPMESQQIPTPTIEKHASSDGGLSKKDRGRYKKLRKRTENRLTHQSVSGFVADNEDWKEWQELSTKLNESCTTSTNVPMNAPYFSWRKGSPENRRTEGAHHRDIIFSILTSPIKTETNENTQGSKKRPRQDSEAKFWADKYKSLPIWISLHNPVTIQSFGVIELHCSSYRQLVDLQRRIKEEIDSSQRSFLSAPTRWFSGHHAKSITEALLFSSPPKHTSKVKQLQHITSFESLVQGMKDFVLTKEELEKADYPIRIADNGEESGNKDVAQAKANTEQLDETSGNNDSSKSPLVWIESLPSRKEQTPRVFALDCEMVETVNGRALARFTMIEAVDYDPKAENLTTRIVLDTFVQPEDRIIDYVTKYSGVTAELLAKGPTMTLSDLQQSILKTVTQKDIVIGHSLENDFRVCQWSHPTCIDTVILFAHQHRSFKYSLRHLASVCLKRFIQQSGKPHCSEEDAQAALDLVVARTVKGPAFGPKDTKSANQWIKLCNSEQRSENEKVVALGPNSWLQQFMIRPTNSSHALACETLQDSSAKAVTSFLSKGSNRKAKLVWAHFRLADDEKDSDTCCAMIKELLSTSSASSSSILVALQNSYQVHWNELGRRKALRNPNTTLTWTDTDEKRLAKTLDDCRLGSSIWIGGPKKS